jgi:ABC-type oligopeptide transport system substrate-binding subunit
LLIAAVAILLNVALIGLVVSRSDPFSSRPASSAPGTVAAPADKQTARIVEIAPRNGDFDSIDPAQIVYGTSYNVGQLVFPGLITLDDAGKPTDWAATSHNVSGDGLTYTFHLHAGMRWSDGAPIDANTFAYSINRTLDPCTASGVASYLYNIKGAAAFNGGECPNGAAASRDTLIGKAIVVVDPLTLKLTLEAPASYFLGTFSYPSSWAVPKLLIDKYGEKWTDHLADNGGFGGNLYKVTKWDHAGHFNLAVNDNFWGQKPTLQRIEYLLYKTVDTAWDDYGVGVGDIGFPPANAVAQAKTHPGYAEVLSLSVSYLRVNWALAPFDDVRVRNAFSLAIDRQALTRAVSGGTAIPSIHMIVQGVPGYSPALKNAAGDSGEQALTANLSKARELAKAYADEKCGGDFAKCPPVQYTYPIEAKAESLRAQALQAEWLSAFPGWRITVQSMAFQSMIKSLKTLQLARNGWGADYADPQDFISVQWSKDAPFNPSAVNVPAADNLEQEADTSTDATGRLALYQRAEQLLVDQGAFMVFEQPISSCVVRPTSKLVKWRISAPGGTSLATWQQAYIAA